MLKCLLVIALCICVGSFVSGQAAASPYVVDGIALGGELGPARDFLCDPSEKFAHYEWCERAQKTRRHAPRSTTSVLRGPGGSVGYVNREIRPVFFRGNDVQTKLKRVKARFGEPAREMRLRNQDDISTAVIVLWGSVELEELDQESRSVELNAISEQDLLIDHLGDIRQSIQRGMPVYRLRGGPGYVWSAASNRSGKGHLRFLAIDLGALSGTTNASAPASRSDGPALAPAKQGAAVATAGDLLPFLGHYPTSAAPSVSGAQPTSQSTNKQQPAKASKTRTDAERARIADAERMAADERGKAQLAWARFEAEKAANETTDRVKWTVIPLLLVLIAIVTLLRMMTRERRGPGCRAQARSSGLQVGS